MKKKVKVELPNGDIIERVPRVRKLGNFASLYIRYNNEEYWIGEGDEYLRGMPEVFKLGKKKQN